jgi:hypothetical protein
MEEPGWQQMHLALSLLKHNFLVTPNFSLTTDEGVDLFHKALGTLQGFINTNEDLVSK